MPDVIACPEPTCRAPARIVDRWTFGSTNGPVEHVKTGCERGHWFTPTVDSLHPQTEQAERIQAAVELARSMERNLTPVPPSAAQAPALSWKDDYAARHPGEAP